MPIHPVWLMFMVVILAIPVVIALVVIFAARAQPASVPPARMASAPETSLQTPLEILARRFASGEITAEEYQKARDLLQGGKPPAT